MNRPPRDLKTRLFSKQRVMVSCLQGLAVLVTTLAVYVFGLYSGEGELDARALGFSALILGNLALIFTVRSSNRGFWATVRSPNFSAWFITLGAIAALAAILGVPALRTFFKFSRIHATDVLLVIGATALLLVSLESLKKVAGLWKHGVAT